MEAGALLRAAPAAGVSGSASQGLLRLSSDAHLVALIRQGRAGAFEVAYDRHHRSILAFCRHMLGDHEEAEDAVQHTFLAAYNDLVASDKPIHLRAWLFTIARNRCYSILRARREHPTAELEEPVTEGLAAQVQRRQDLRDLVFDMQRLPEDQRAALVLAELDSLSHEQIGQVLGVPREKVKALVFQARESLVASRAARETDCGEIREQLANMRGGALRRGNLRRHLRECAGCRDFRKQVDRQRRQLALLLPVAPTLALKDSIMGATVGGGMAAVTAGGGLLASSAIKAGLLKSVVGAALAGIGAAGAIVAVQDVQTRSSFVMPTNRLSAVAPISPVAHADGASARAPSPEIVVRSSSATTNATWVRLSSPSSATGSYWTSVAVLNPFAPVLSTSSPFPSAQWVRKRASAVKTPHGSAGPVPQPAASGLGPGTSSARAIGVAPMFPSPSTGMGYAGSTGSSGGRPGGYAGRGDGSGSSSGFPGAGRSPSGSSGRTEGGHSSSAPATGSSGAQSPLSTYSGPSILGNGSSGGSSSGSGSGTSPSSSGNGLPIPMPSGNAGSSSGGNSGSRGAGSGSGLGGSGSHGG